MNLVIPSDQNHLILYAVCTVIGYVLRHLDILKVHKKEANKPCIPLSPS